MSQVPALLGPDERPVPPALIEAIRTRAAGAGGGMRASLNGGGFLPHGDRGFTGYGSAFPYDAADWSSAELGDWLPGIQSPDREINWHRDRMVARQRDLYRNDGWAHGAIGNILDSTIGAEYRLIVKPDWRRLRLFATGFDEVWAREYRQVIEALWRDYFEDLYRYNDVQRQLTGAQQFRLSLGHKLIDGENVLLPFWLPERVGRGGADYATAFLGIDPDRLSNPMLAPDDKFMRGGIEIDDLGVPVAAHIRRAEPNDWYNAVESMQWERVPFEDEDGFVRVIHDFDRDRWSQHRGVSVFAPILSRLKMLARYYGVELQAATVASVFGTFITSPFDSELVGEALTSGDDRLGSYQDLRGAFHDKHQLQLNKVRIPMLAPGEDIKTVSAERPSGQFSPFTHEMLRSVAACLGTSETEIHKDLGSANYSSIRAGIVTAEKTYVRRTREFNLNTATPVFACWLHEVFEQGLAPLPRNAPSFREGRTAYSRGRWLGPASGWVDPVAERQGVVLGLDAALSTLEEECARQGLDYEEVLDQRAYELSLMRERNIPPPVWMGDKVSATEATRKPEAA